mmetsp:Transcript_37458/g.105788  ORF Transcript_37458/g.105788 Transcript_37458/m.105788 type:complete len:260 (+) Transcript_37458:34-813(+)
MLRRICLVVRHGELRERARGSRVRGRVLAVVADAVDVDAQLAAARPGRARQRPQGHLERAVELRDRDRVLHLRAGLVPAGHARLRDAANHVPPPGHRLDPEDVPHLHEAPRAPQVPQGQGPLAGEAEVPRAGHRALVRDAQVAEQRGEAAQQRVQRQPPALRVGRVVHGVRLEEMRLQHGPGLDAGGVHARALLCDQLPRHQREGAGRRGGVLGDAQPQQAHGHRRGNAPPMPVRPHTLPHGHRHVHGKGFPRTQRLGG